MTVVKVNNVNLNYEQMGEGEAVIFLHGYTGSTQDWRNQMPLVAQNYRATAVDHRGHGKSEAPAAEDDYSIKTFSEDIYALLGALNINKCCLVGHSMGGFMSLQFVLDHPEMVKALVLVDTSSGSYDTPPGYAELRAKLDELARTKGLEAAFEYDAENNPMRVERFKNHPEQREISRQKVLSTSVDGYIYVARTFRKWPPVTDRLNEIKVPTLIFWGEEDTPFTESSQAMKEAISEAELITVPGVGHNPHEEAPAIFNEALMNFLSRIQW
ncbi:MAG: alpha/beta fold hydrolase [Deltaproteobacteria bacterium]|nr:alpha/beta fold hydrolase [Deltaproteobacteria bacterium]